MQFVTNSISTATERTFEGRTYLVAPVVMLAAGVLSDALVTAEEAGKYVQSWAGRPVTLGHPTHNGEYVSAGTPEINALQAPGQLWNAAFADGKLKAEIWIDIAKATSIGGDAVKVMDRLRSNQPVEVSTGYFADNELSSGVYNGKRYSMIARNLRPDHLALLPDGVGACSWQDGCGTPRVNEANATCHCQKGKAMNKEKVEGEAEAEVTNNVQAHRIADESFISAVVSGLLSALGRGKQTISANAEEDEDMVGINTETPAVEVPVVNTFDKLSASKQDAVQADVLVNIATMLEKLNSRIDGIDAKLTANADKERNDIVAALAVNERCPFDEGELKALSTAHLHKLASAYQLADYSLGAGVVANRGDTYETLAMPAWAVAGEGK